VLSSLGIDLWPDYDRPGLLVIYRATMAPGVTLPTPLVFRIPAAAGVPTAVAERQTDGQLITLPYERTLDGDTARIAVVATRPIVQIEYYDPAITREGTRRSFVFSWPGDYEVGDFSVSVQQPDLAQGLTLVPEASSVAPSVDGLMYHTVVRAGVAAGETVEIRASYEKTSDQLSIETMAPVESESSTPTAAAAPASDTSTVVIVMAAALVFAAAVAVGLTIRSRRPAGAAATGGPSRGSSGQPGKKASRFCTQCGAGADGGDRFCHRCGAELTG